VALGLASWALILPLAENRRFLFTYMHLLLSIVIVIVIAVIVRSSTPISSVSTLLGGITFKSMFYKFASLAQTQTQQHKHKTKQKTNVLELPATR
jgi:phosphate/sulfate permease